MILLDSIEIDEIHYPMRVYERSLVPDSEGAGRHRGTVASRVEYGPIGCQMRVIFSTDSTRYPPRGARGGLSPTPARHCKRALSGNLSELDPVSDLLLESGESVIGVSCGGGGYGSPLDRDRNVSITLRHFGE